MLHRLVFEHLNRLFPQKAGTAYGESGRDRGMNSYVNGALGATGEWPHIRPLPTAIRQRDDRTFTRTGSDYFSLCFKEHIPEDVDLVVIELGEREVLMTRGPSAERHSCQ